MSTTSTSTSRTRVNRNARRMSFSKTSNKSKSLLSLSSDKSVASLNPINERHHTYEDAFGNRNKEVIRFVYSEAVERAFRRTYRITDFGPFSAYNPAEPGVEIRKLQELYVDFLHTKDMSQHNKQYIAKLRKELGDRYEEYEKVEIQTKTKASKMALRNAITLAKFRQRSRAESVAKLPPLLPASPCDERMLSESRSQSRTKSRKSSMTRASSNLSVDTSIDLDLDLAQSRSESRMSGSGREVRVVPGSGITSATSSHRGPATPGS